MTDPRAPLTLPAMYALMHANAAAECLATKDGEGGIWILDDAEMWFRSTARRYTLRPIIPEPTPADRVVVLPEVGGVTETSQGTLACGSSVAGGSATESGCRECAGEHLRVAAAFVEIAAFIAARDAEPTPDPLAERLTLAGEWLDGQENVASGIYDTLRAALLAATEVDQ